MNWSRRRSVGVAAVVGLAMVSMLAVDALGTRPLFGRPTSVAVVRIEMVLNQLNERAEAQTELRSLGESIEAEVQRRQANVDALLKEREGADALRQRELEDQIALMSLENQEWIEFKRSELDLEKALMIEGLYRSVRIAMADLATAQGYDLVLIDDSVREFSVNPESRMPREIQVRQQLLSRRVLYAGDAVDVTNDLVERMNNAFDAG
ncbi:MAG: OmpH family outer membrane protein [Planctomycetota bacterium]